MNSNKFKMAKLSLATLALAAVTVPMSAARAELTYDYTGNLFNQTYLPDGSTEPLTDMAIYGTHITGSVTFEKALNTTFTGIANETDIESFNLTSSTVTASENGSLEPSSFTFSHGSIVGWDFRAATDDGHFFLQTIKNGVGENDFSFDYLDYTVDRYEGNVVYGNPGTWTLVSPVPLPGTVGMLGSALLGLIGFAGVRRKQFVTSAT